MHPKARRVHFIYPSGPEISCPHAIGRRVTAGLRQHGYEVIQSEYHAMTCIDPEPGNVLLGHIHPFPLTAFRRSLRKPGWKRVILMAPFAHGFAAGKPPYPVFWDTYLRRCDLLLAITGRYWFESLERSIFSHWKPKMVQIDLAVDRTDFPAAKSKFRPPGSRRFVYIGSKAIYKNIRYLTQIARALPGMEFAWIGSGHTEIEGLQTLGRQDFRTREARQLVAGYDFLLTVGSSDPNPTTILESMAWGLIPVCTPESGYVGYPSILNIPLDDVRGASRELLRLQQLSDESLRSLQRENWQLLDAYFNWDRFVAQVAEAIESKISPELERISRTEWLKLRYYGLISPHSGFVPFLKIALRALLKRVWLNSPLSKMPRRG